jgi:formylglycine-generating enzyme required for sulfatase activity
MPSPFFFLSLERLGRIREGSEAMASTLILRARRMRNYSNDQLTRTIRASLLAIAAAHALCIFPQARAQTRPNTAGLPSPQRSVLNEGIAVLRSRSGAYVHLGATSFAMGSRQVDLQIAMSLCSQERFASKCSEDLFKHEMMQHVVSLPSFWMDRLEVSVGDYERCVFAGRCEAASFEQGAGRFRRDEYPVTMVTWFSAREYCKYAGGRLPTEAEWERAARGPNGRRFPWGEQSAPMRANHGRLALEETDDSDGYAELAPRGSFSDGRTFEGVEDLAGNVAEWVEDTYEDAYEALPVTSPKGPSFGAYRVIRGGSYVHSMAWLRGASRDYRSPSVRLHYLGFRCVYDSSPIFD